MAILKNAILSLTIFLHKFQKATKVPKKKNNPWGPCAPQKSPRPPRKACAPKPVVPSPQEKQATNIQFKPLDKAKAFPIRNRL